MRHKNFYTIFSLAILATLCLAFGFIMLFAGQPTPTRDYEYPPPEYMQLDKPQYGIPPPRNPAIEAQISALEEQAKSYDRLAQATQDGKLAWAYQTEAEKCRQRTLEIRLYGY